MDAAKLRRRLTEIRRMFDVRDAHDRVPSHRADAIGELLDALILDLDAEELRESHDAKLWEAARQAVRSNALHRDHHGEGDPGWCHDCGEPWPCSVEEIARLVEAEHPRGAGR